MDSEKSINSFEMKKGLVIGLFIEQFVHNFAALLCKINVLDIFDTGDFFYIFVILQSTEILMESNFLLEMYVPYILKLLQIY